MKKKIYLLPVIMLISLVTVIGLSSCKPPEIIYGKDLGVEITGEMVGWAMIFYDMYNTDGSYIERLIEKKDEHFEDVADMMGELFKHVKLEKLKKQPSGAKRGMLITYADGSTSHYYVTLKNSLVYFNFDDIWYESDVNNDLLGEIYAYTVKYGSEGSVFGIQESKPAKTQQP